VVYEADDLALDGAAEAAIASDQASEAQDAFEAKGRRKSSIVRRVEMTPSQILSDKRVRWAPLDRVRVRREPPYH
jgi:hypothetical protein